MVIPNKKISYKGVWTATDAQGQVFDIVLFPNSQAVTPSVKEPAGPSGERGY